MRACAQLHLGATQLFESDDEFGHEFPAARGSAVREARLGVRPRHLLRVEIQRVGRELRHPHARMPGKELPDDLSPVYRAPVPEHDDRTAPGSQQDPQERADLGLSDVLRVDVVAKAQAMRVRADREAADDREAISRESMANDRPFAARRLGAPQVRNELKSPLIDEGQPRVTGLGVFSEGVATLARATPRSPPRLARSRVVRASAASSLAAGACAEDGRGDSAHRTDARSMRRSAARSTVSSRIRVPWLPCESLAGARAAARGPVSLATTAAAEVGVAHRAIASPNSARIQPPRRRRPTSFPATAARVPVGDDEQELRPIREDTSVTLSLPIARCIYLARRKMHVIFRLTPARAALLFGPHVGALLRPLEGNGAGVTK